MISGQSKYNALLTVLNLFGLKFSSIVPFENWNFGAVIVETHHKSWYLAVMEQVGEQNCNNLCISRLEVNASYTEKDK